MDRYMEPDRFRSTLNALIQDLRNVSFLVQKQKGELEGFADWYPDWQVRVAADPVMVWVKNARNRVVKQADLELKSTARLVMAFDWMNEAERSFVFPPRFKPADIARMLYERGVPPFPAGEGSLTVERRWVDRLLPDRELLDGCAHALAQLTQLVASAHEAAGVSKCDLVDRDRPCVTSELVPHMDCMWLGEDTRKAHFDLGSLTQYESRTIRVFRDEKAGRAAAEKYGLDGPGEFGSNMRGGDAIDRVPHLFKMGQRFLAVDGEVTTVVWLLRGEEIVDIQAPVFADQATKMLAYRALATRVEMMQADGAVCLGEMWTSAAPSGKNLKSGRFLPPRSDPNRGESLQAVGVTKDGRSRSMLAAFTRKESVIEFEEPTDDLDIGVNMLLRPILAAWGIADPSPQATINAIADRWDASQSRTDRE